MENFTTKDLLTQIFDFILYAFLLSLIIVFIKNIKNEFATPFYRLLLLIFIAHFIFWPPVILIGIQFWSYGIWREWFLKNGWLKSFNFTFSVYLDNVIYTAQCLIALNRLTGVWFPFQNKRIWKHKWYLYFSILFPISTVAYRFTAEGYFRVRENGTLDSGYVDKEFEAFSITITALTLGITFVISLLFNILTIYKYKMTQTSMIASDDISAKLIIYSVLLTMIQCVRFGYNRMRFIFLYNPAVISVVLSIYSYVTAAHAIVASVGILILSRKTRQIYFNFYFSSLKVFEPGKIFQISSTQVSPA